jgi:uncharacterized protein YndB with AHSA1/START domain
MRINEEPIIVEQTFEEENDTVWDSITRVDLMRKWYFDNIPSFEPEVGFETQFNVVSGGRNFLHLWKVTEVVPRKKIIYNWKYDGYPGDSLVTFELFIQDHLTKLRLTHKVQESFPEDIPEFSRESCIGGWEFFIKKSLKEYLEKYIK